MGTESRDAPGHTLQPIYSTIYNGHTEQHIYILFSPCYVSFFNYLLYIRVKALIFESSKAVYSTFIEFKYDLLKN